MATNNQTITNRRNSEQSTGPVSVDGKAVSSQNSRKHGLLSREIVLPDEDMEAFTLSRERLLADLNPVGELESILAERLIGLSWRLRRSAKMEAAILWFQRHDALASSVHQNDISHDTVRTLLRSKTSKLESYEAYEAEKESDLSNYGVGFVRDSKHDNALSKLSRYETSMNRNFLRTLHELQRLQAARQGKQVPVPQVMDLDVSGGGSLAIEGAVDDEQRNAGG